jgi:hypothetical protein
MKLITCLSSPDQERSSPVEERDHGLDHMIFQFGGPNEREEVEFGKNVCEVEGEDRKPAWTGIGTAFAEIA